MRRTVAFALLALLPMAIWAATPDSTATPKKTSSKNKYKLATPTAEPENGQAYAKPTPHQNAGPSGADRGPAQRNFTMASGIDAPLDPNATPPSLTPSPETVQLDKNIRVPLVHDVQNDATYRYGQNDSLYFEIKYLNWGANTEEQLRARQGHYFTITCVNDGPSADLIAKFEYRQVKSGEIERSLEQPLPHASGAVRAYFAVVDKAYLTYGPISAWRFTVRHGDTVVAEARSFLW